MDEDIEKLKSVLRSLVVSSPTQVTVFALIRDYKNMIGTPLPVSKYGHRDPVQFLKERFSDCFLFGGPASNPILTLIVPDKLKHIDKFVQCQKSSSGRCAPKRRSVLESIVSPPKVNQIYESFTQKKTSQSDREPPKSNTESIRPSNAINVSSEPNKSTNNHNIVPSQPKVDPPSKPNVTPNKPIDTSDKPKSNSTLTKTEYSKQNLSPDKHLAVLTKPENDTLDKHVEGLNKANSAPTKTNVNYEKSNSSPEKLPTVLCKSKNVSIRPNLVPSKSYLTPCGHNGINVNNKDEDDRHTEIKTEHISGDNSDAVMNFLKKRLPAYNSLHHLDGEKTADRWGITHDDDSGRHTLSSSNSAKAQQLEQLKSEIMVLISDAPEGVWCTDVIRLYRERYNRELNFARFGFTSILSLVYCLENDVQITRPVDTGDWLLQERVRASTAPPALRLRRSRTTHLIPHSSRKSDPDEALPGIDFDPDVFPEDCMHFMESIDSLSLSDFRPGAMIEVMIGEVYSPSHFWFIRLGDNYNVAMEDMMDEMSHYYNNEGRDRVLARGAVRVGHYCSSLYEKDWHRSLIVKIVDSDTVKVRHVDYGTVDTVAVSALKPLRREWSRLAAQAGRARLAGVRPPAAGWRWPRAAAAAFLALVSNRRLVANVVAIDQRDMVAEVLLIDTSSDEDVCIGTELIRAGHADTRADSALRTLDVYLYPRFEALESGATPNYAEIHAYLRDGIALDYVEEYRAHVPAVLPDPAPLSESPAASPASSTSPAPLDHPPPSESPDPTFQTSSESGLTDSPVPQPNSDPAPEVENATEVSELPTRIPLLLPEVPPPKSPSPVKTETKPQVESGTPAQQGPQLPVPPSYLSPHAPAYVPGAPYPLAPAPYRAAAPAEFSRSPPPPYGGPPLLPTPGVTLSLAECETYRALSHVNPAAAHWFIVGAMGRAASRPVTPMPPSHPPMFPPHPQMHPSHPQMLPPHVQMHPPPPHMHPPHLPMHPMHPPLRIRPPPGFGT